MKDLLINTTRSHLQAATLTLSTCGHLEGNSTHDKTLSIKRVAVSLGLEADGVFFHPRVNRIYVDFGKNICGYFPFNPGDGMLGEFVRDVQAYRQAA